MDELVFYSNPMSRGRVVRWMLEEVGAPYETKMLQFGSEMKAPAYLAINPMGKVPALRHGDQIVTEAAAICAYLADAFPGANLAPPPASPLRAPYYRWLFFAAGPLEAAITNKTLKFEVPEGRDRLAGYGSLDLTLRTLEAAVTGRKYLAGDAFSAADVYVGAQVGLGMMFGSIERRPALTDYFGGLGERPAYIRASALDDALVPAQPVGAA